MEAEKFRSQARGGLEGSRPMMDVWSGLAGWLEIPCYLGRQGAAIRSRVRAWPVGTGGGGGALPLCCGRRFWARVCKFEFRLRLTLAWPMDGGESGRVNVDGWTDCIESHQMVDGTEETHES